MKIPKILVIGDVMIDKYVNCLKGKVNPESDAPLINEKSLKNVWGGAANVAYGLKQLGADVSLCSVINDELPGLNTSLCLKVDNTTVKTRIMCDGKQVLRIDNDYISDVDLTVNLTDLKHYDLIIISDYAKGVVTKEVVIKAIESGVKVIVDPKGSDYSKYDGAFLIKPNEKELQAAGGYSEVKKHCKYVLGTFAEKGMELYGHGIIPAQSENVIDVTGAGDTVLSTLSYFIAMGDSVLAAAVLANMAAGISIQHIGNYNPELKEIMACV